MSKTYIFDIDNTLCDTWSTLKESRRNILFRFLSETRRVSFIPAFDNMMGCVRSRKSRKGSQVYFLSARHWSLWFATYIYLVRHVGFFSPFRLTLVPSAANKIDKLNQFLTLKDGLIIVVDDLTYNTEFGQTRYYSKVINYLMKHRHRIRYVNKNNIDIINKT